VAVLTADHGFTPAPEYSQALGYNTGRVNGGQMLARINKGLEPRFGQGPFVRFISANALVLDRNIIAARGIAFDAVADAARNLLLAEPGIGVAFTRAELESRSAAGQPFFDAMERSFDPAISGDVQFAFKPYWIAASTTSVTSHGSPHPY